MLQGSYAPFASKSWFQKEIAKITNKDEKNLEIKIEKVHQNENPGKEIVVHGAMDKE